MTDALSLLSMVLATLLGLVLFGMAALTTGADSREPYGDDYRRPKRGAA